MAKQIPVDLEEDALLWLINRQVFHPRGYALGHDPDTHEFVLLGDGSEPYTFPGHGEDEVAKLARIQEIMP